MDCGSDNVDQVDHSIMPPPTPPTPPDSTTGFPLLRFGSMPPLVTRLAPRPRPPPPRRVPLGYLDVINPPGREITNDVLTNPPVTRGDGCCDHHYRNTDSRAFWASMRQRSQSHLNRMLTDADYDNAIFGNTEASEDEASDDSNASEENTPEENTSEGNGSEEDDSEEDGSEEGGSEEDDSEEDDSEENASEEILSDGSSDALDVLPKRDPIEDKARETNSEQAQRTQPSRPAALSDAWLAFLNRNKDKDEGHANETEECEGEAGLRGVGLLSFERRTRIEAWRKGCIHGAKR